MSVEIGRKSLPRPAGGVPALAVILLVAWAIGIPRPALAQHSVTTEDGLSLSLSSSGAVTGLRIRGVEAAASGVASGFVFRELPPAPTDAAANGNFEAGGTGPAGWSWSNGPNASWTWEAGTASDGSRSMKLSIPGTVARRGPSLLSANLPLRPGTPYSFRGRIRTAGLTGALTLSLVERRSDGVLVQRGVKGPTGTTDWTEVEMTFTTSPLAETASFKAEVLSGAGTAWLDEVRLLDIFGGRTAAAFGGEVTSDEDGLTQTARCRGSHLRARLTSVGLLTGWMPP